MEWNVCDGVDEVRRVRSERELTYIYIYIVRDRERERGVEGARRSSDGDDEKKIIAQTDKLPLRCMGKVLFV